MKKLKTNKQTKKSHDCDVQIILQVLEKAVLRQMVGSPLITSLVIES